MLNRQEHPALASCADCLLTPGLHLHSSTPFLLLSLACADPAFQQRWKAGLVLPSCNGWIKCSCTVLYGCS